MYKIAYTIIILTFFWVGASSQTVVLINGVPTKVELSGTEIVRVIGVQDNYMAGYSGAQNDYQTVDPGSTSSPVSTAVSTTSPIATSNTTTANQSSSVATNTTTNFSGNYFKFDSNSALLSQLAINEIKDYAGKITSGQASKITLQSLYRTNSQRSEKLVKNRLDACKKYLELNGVSPSAITVESIPNQRQSDKVSITLQ